MKHAILAFAALSTLAVLAVLALGACNTPTPRLQLAFAGPPSQACPSTDCAQVEMKCDAVMSIRIIDPASPASPYLSQCVRVAPQHDNMCVIAGVDLDPVKIPVHDLEVQVALYPVAAISANPINPDVLQCPAKVEYSAATGFPVEQAPAPALGGHAFYHPGDTTVTVTLGCTDLAAINDSCMASNLITVAATITDFNTRFPVMGGSQGLADRLLVSIGEPRAQGSSFVLDAPDTHPLGRTSDGQPPSWGGEVDYSFNRYVCLEVFEVAGQSTATLRCQQKPSSTRLELGGVWLAKAQLDELLLALGATEFPEAGLTVGMVIDDVGRPVAGAVVSATTGTLTYPSAAGSGFAGSGTSASGIFLSRDAGFGTVFSTGRSGQPMVEGIGGQVAGRVTVVILSVGAPPPG
jgi:hypothetical protein